MVKEIDVRRAKQEPLAQKKVTPMRSVPTNGTTHPPAGPNTTTAPVSPQSPTQKTQSFISRFFDIMVCDIMVLFHRPLSEKQEDIVKKIRDFEQFEEFCKKARGER